MSTFSTSRYPTGDASLAGASTWYGGASTYRYDKVNETPASTAQTISLQSSAAVVMLSISSFSIPAGSTVTLVRQYFLIQPNTTRASNFKTLLTVNSSSLAGANFTPTTVVSWYTTYHDYTVNQNGTTWSVADVNAISAIGVATTGIRQVDIAQTYLYVTYDADPNIVISSVSSAIVSNVADSTGITQSHNISLSNAANANAAGEPAPGTNLTITVADCVQQSNSGETYYLVDESGNRITDESGNYLVLDWFGGLVLTEEIPPSSVTAADAYTVNAADDVTLAIGHVIASVDSGIQANVADAPTLTINENVSVTAAAAVNANVSESPSLIQGHVISVSDGAQVNAAESPDLSAIILSVTNAVQQNNSGETYYLVDESGNRITDESGNYIVLDWFGGLVLTENAGTPATTVTAADSYVANAADAPSMVQAQLLASAADGTQINVTDAPAPIVGHTVTVSDGTQANAGADVTLTQGHIISVSAGVQANVADAPSPTQAHLLSISDGVQANVADAPSMIQDYLMGVYFSVQVVNSDAPSLVQHHLISIDNGIQNNIAEAPAILTEGSIGVSDAVQVNAADAPSLAQHHLISASDSAQANVAGDVSVTQTHLLTVDNTVQPNVAGVPVPVENVSSVDTSVTADNCIQVNAGGDIVLIQNHVITVDNASDISVTEALIVLIGHTISAQDSGQIVTDSAIALIQQHNITITDGTQENHSDGIDFSLKAEPGDTYNANAASDIILEVHTRTVGKKVRTSKPVREGFRQEKIYQHTYRRAGDVWRSR